MRSSFIIDYYAYCRQISKLYGLSGKCVSQAILNYYTGREFNKRYLKFINFKDIIEVLKIVSIIKLTITYGKELLETILCINNLIQFSLLPVKEREVKITSSLGHEIIVGRTVVIDSIEIVRNKLAIGRASVTT